MGISFETEFVAWLSERLPAHESLSVRVGDDGAVWDDLVVTTDLLSDGVDFVLDEVDPQRIGRKSLAVNLSDLAAMAAVPQAGVVALAMPSAHDQPLEIAKQLYEGILELAEEFDIAIIGGDTNMHEGPLVISITAFGKVTEHGPLTRTGGQPGDQLLVTGKLGGSILGHHLDFTPRVHEALLLNEKYDLHAGMDISDGLALDASRLVNASDCGAVIDSMKVPIAEAAYELEKPKSRAMYDGEDFELLLAVPPEGAQILLADQPLECGLTHIGELIKKPGLWQLAAEGQMVKLEPKGWLHG